MSYDDWKCTEPDPCPEGRGTRDPYRCKVCHTPINCRDIYCAACKVSVRSQRYVAAARRKGAA